MQVKSFGLTHVGRQRQHNEDSFLVEDKAKLYLVADGMGGHAAGEIASRIAVDSISEFIIHTKEDDGTWPHAYDDQYRRSTNRLMAAVRMANTRVLEAMRKDARLRGMGTTVVAALGDDPLRTARIDALRVRCRSAPRPAFDERCWRELAGNAARFLEVLEKPREKRSPKD